MAINKTNINNYESDLIFSITSDFGIINIFSKVGNTTLYKKNDLGNYIELAIIAKDDNMGGVVIGGDYKLSPAIGGSFNCEYANI